MSWRRAAPLAAVAVCAGFLAPAQAEPIRTWWTLRGDGNSSVDMPIVVPVELYNSVAGHHHPRVRKGAASLSLGFVVQKLPSLEIAFVTYRADPTSFGGTNWLYFGEASQVLLLPGLYRFTLLGQGPVEFDFPVRNTLVPTTIETVVPRPATTIRHNLPVRGARTVERPLTMANGTLAMSYLHRRAYGTARSEDVFCLLPRKGECTDDPTAFRVTARYSAHDEMSITAPYVGGANPGFVERPPGSYTQRVTAATFGSVREAKVLFFELPVAVTPAGLAALRPLGGLLRSTGTATVAPLSRTSARSGRGPRVAVDG